MKLTSIAAVFVFVTITASAWDLTVYTDDGRHVESDGTVNSDCVNYDVDMNSPVNRAVFQGSTFADTFELYENKNCQAPVSYRNGEGDFTLTPRKIQSYNVY